jgi:hypothetical protein
LRRPLEQFSPPRFPTSAHCSEGVTARQGK